MEAHAHAICSSGGDVLNVGFGLGLIDEVGSSLAPSSILSPTAHILSARTQILRVSRPLHMCPLEQP